MTYGTRCAMLRLPLFLAWMVLLTLLVTGEPPATETHPAPSPGGTLPSPSAVTPTSASVLLPDGTGEGFLHGKAWYFTGAPWRGGPTRSARRIGDGAAARLQAMGRTLSFVPDGHHSLSRTITQEIIRDWTSGQLDFICLIGYSWGARVHDVAAALGEKGIPVELLVYIDPINHSLRRESYSRVPPNVRHAYRLQSRDPLIHSRSDLVPMDPAATTCTNLRLDSPLWFLPLYTHIATPSRSVPLVEELLVRGMCGDLERLRFTQEMGKDRSGNPRFRVKANRGWDIGPETDRLARTQAGDEPAHGATRPSSGSAAAPDSTMQGTPEAEQAAPSAPAREGQGN